MPQLLTGNEDEAKREHVSAASLRENVAFHGSADELSAVASAGPRGAFAVAGLAVLVLLALWLSFFFFVFAPRGGNG
ncbi:hypothetical protein QTI66_04630 [Variovorax sp. J22R133]|uniref:hypothetical protein n=1 Tax=Variovorax brevis TaxID=3053503 RepID=UPI002576E7C7|nr:hypothetical protein [Variovorax sp. J22R133]MDM0111422.1 hypothetical protein [Variovorax sp. J22R133]